MNNQSQNLLWTPIRHNATQPNLFRIICYVGPKTKDGAAEVPIRASNNLRGIHEWLERGKNDIKAYMVELATESLKHWLLSLAFAC
jgi:hypothetical protein